MSVSSWEPDPTGRHQYRWWDGAQWTDQVANDGVQSVDSISAAEAQLPQSAGPSTQPPPPAGGELRADAPRSDTGAVPDDPLTMLASQGQRFGAFLLDLVLVVVTLGIGYLIWSLVVWGRGQTPAKQLLKLRVIRLNDRRAASWGIMAVRQFVLVAVVFGVDAALGGFGLISLLWLLANGITLLATDKNQALWDKILSTVVVSEPNNAY